jgi:hypothetical protein
MNRVLYKVALIHDALDEYPSITGESLLCADCAIWLTYVDRAGRANLHGVIASPDFAPVQARRASECVSAK